MNVTDFFHWQHKLCATFSANGNINYRLPVKVYYRICTLRPYRIEINHGRQNVLWVLTWGAGTDPGFQVRGVELKKIAPSGGRRENFWGISCEKSRFYAKKNHIFSNFRGGGAPGVRAPPPGSAPGVVDISKFYPPIHVKTQHILASMIYFLISLTRSWKSSTKGYWAHFLCQYICIPSTYIESGWGKLSVRRVRVEKILYILYHSSWLRSFASCSWRDVLDTTLCDKICH